MNVEISKEDFEFLKDLQHELNSQDDEGTADPLVWNIIEEKQEFVPEGCGDEMICHDDGIWSFDDATDYINEVIDEYDIVVQDQWNLMKNDLMDIYDICNFLVNELGIKDCKVCYVEKKSQISDFSGSFLTKRACLQHIERNKYHYNNPHAYATCAYRNYELERLLDILKTIKLDEQ